MDKQHISQNYLMHHFSRLSIIDPSSTFPLIILLTALTVILLPSCHLSCGPPPSPSMTHFHLNTFRLHFLLQSLVFFPLKSMSFPPFFLPFCLFPLSPLSEYLSIFFCPPHLLFLHLYTQSLHFSSLSPFHCPLLSLRPTFPSLSLLSYILPVLCPYMYTVTVATFQA